MATLLSPSSERNILTYELLHDVQLQELINNRDRLEQKYQHHIHQREIIFFQLKKANTNIIAYIVQYYDNKIKQLIQDDDDDDDNDNDNDDDDDDDISDDPSNYTDDENVTFKPDQLLIVKSEQVLSTKNEPIYNDESTETHTEDDDGDNTHNNHNYYHANIENIEANDLNELLNKTIENKRTEIKSKLIELKLERDIFDGKKIPKITDNIRCRTPNTIQRDIDTLENVLRQKQNNYNYNNMDIDELNNNYNHNDDNDDNDDDDEYEEEEEEDEDEDLLSDLRRTEETLYCNKETIKTEVTQQTQKKQRESISSNYNKPRRVGDEDKIYIYCSHYKYGTSSKERCGVHYVRFLTHRPHQAQHKCTAYNPIKTITRTRNKYYNRCDQCHGNEVCMKDAVPTQINQYLKYCDDNHIDIQSGNKNKKRKRSNSSNLSSTRIPKKRKIVKDEYDESEDSEETDQETEDEESESDDNDINKPLQRPKKRKQHKLDRSELEKLSLDRKIALALHYKPNLIDQQNWCRYCGSIYSVGYYPSPWGPRKLCTRHYTKWHKEQSLNLSNWTKEPIKPINPSQNNDPQTLIRIIQKEQDKVYAKPPKI